MSVETGVLSDEIMRKKLLIDGEGIGDDRRLTLFIKNFFKWCHQPSDSESDSENVNQFERLELMLDQCDSAMVKSFQVQKTHQAEIENYDSLYSTIENSLIKAKQKNMNFKNELLNARRVRKNKQEYDVLAKVIVSEPDRENTLKKLQEIDHELDEIQNTTNNLQKKIDVRRKQSHVLISAINQILYFVEEDENESNKENGEEQMDVAENS